MLLVPLDERFTKTKIHNKGVCNSGLLALFHTQPSGCNFLTKCSGILFKQIETIQKAMCVEEA